MAQYHVWITTGDATLAGTDSHIFIRLLGTTTNSDALRLPARDIFAFESGATDKFVLEVPELGDLLECCIGQDNTDSDSGWYIKTVRVQHSQTGKEWVFIFERWLGGTDTGELSACVGIA